MTENDAVARLQARFAKSPHPLFTDADFADVRAVLAEVEQLRDEREDLTKALAPLAQSAARQVAEGTKRLDAYWPGWREFFAADDVPPPEAREIRTTETDKENQP